MNALIKSAFIGCALLTFSCVEDECQVSQEQTFYSPVYRTTAEVRDGVVVTQKKQESFGKIYIYKQYLLISEPEQGIHIYDNSDISSPEKITFIAIPGNHDLAVRNDQLYADSYMDLVVLDIANIEAPELVNRINNTFVTNYYPFDVDGEEVIVADLEEVTDVYEYNECDQNFRGFPMHFRNGMETVLFASASAAPPTNVSGIGGSMARFTISNSHLYAVDMSDLHSFSLEGELQKTDSQYVGFNIETIFPYQDNLFIGSAAGMFIYSISNPSSPNFLSEFQHANACDPVFVDYPYAYVTLRSGTECQGFTNQLEVIDITDLESPVLKYTYPMDNPHGLSIYNNQLYLCEGSYGLKVFDVTDPGKIDQQLVKTFDMEAFDVIVHNNQMILTGPEGIMQKHLDRDEVYRLQ